MSPENRRIYNFRERPSQMKDAERIAELRDISLSDFLREAKEAHVRRHRHLLKEDDERRARESGG